MARDKVDDTIKLVMSSEMKRIIEGNRRKTDTLGERSKGQRKIKGHSTLGGHTEDIEQISAQLSQMWNVTKSLITGLKHTNQGMRTMFDKGFKIAAAEQKKGGDPVGKPPSWLVRQLLTLFGGTTAKSGEGGIGGKGGGGMVGGFRKGVGIAKMLTGAFMLPTRMVEGAAGMLDSLSTAIPKFIEAKEKSFVAIQYAKEVRAGEDTGAAAKLFQRYRTNPKSMLTRPVGIREEQDKARAFQKTAGVPYDFARSGGAGMFLRNNLYNQNLGTEEDAKRLPGYGREEISKRIRARTAALGGDEKYNQGKDPNAVDETMGDLEKQSNLLRQLRQELAREGQPLPPNAEVVVGKLQEEMDRFFADLRKRR